MHRMLLWFASGVMFTLSVMLIVFGAVFLRDFYLFNAEAALGSLLFGVILLLVGGGLLSATVAETVRRVSKKEQ